MIPLGEMSMMPRFKTPADVFEETDRRLRAGAGSLAATSATYLVELAGDSGGIFHIVISNGRGSAAPGAAKADPDVIIAASAADFMTFVQGTLDDALLAFMAGQVTITGNQSLAIALAPLWFDDSEKLLKMDNPLLTGNQSLAIALAPLWSGGSEKRGPPRVGV
jgi:SCP-2 sterol transfer family